MARPLVLIVHDDVSGDMSVDQMIVDGEQYGTAFRLGVWQELACRN